MDYKEKLKDPRWQKIRLKIFERDEWKCTNCGDEKSTLHCHHEEYVGEPWDIPCEKLSTLCENCHTEKSSKINRIKVFLESIGVFGTIAPANLSDKENEKYTILIYSIKENKKGEVKIFNPLPIVIPESKRRLIEKMKELNALSLKHI